MSVGTIILIVVIAIIVLIVFYAIGVYNKLVGARNKVDDQWSQIDVQIKKRADLIPNIVETVKGYASHEKDTLADVINARNMAVNAKSVDEEIKADNMITEAVSKLFALSEAYPDLKANTNFLSLQSDLKDIEEKIGYARQFYNDTVMSYNNIIEMFPSNIIASMFKFKKATFFDDVSEKEREVPKVKF